MAVTVTHSTPADGTFSAAGAIAWDANHTLTGLGTMAEANTSDYLTTAAIAAAYQPLDADLTSIAALTTTAYGRGLLELANASALRTSAGLVIGTDVQAYDAQLADVAALSPTKGRLIVGDGTNWVDLGVGTDTHVLTADSAQTKGVKWAAATASGGGTKTIQKFTPLDNQPPASNFATLDTRNSVATLDFDDTTEEAAVFVGVINQGADLTSGLKVRIFWAATSATSGNVRWGAQFEKYGSDIDSDSFDTATEAHTATSGTSGIVVVTEITCTTIDSLSAGDQFRLKIYRDVSDTTNDTVTGDAELIAVEVQQVA